MSGIKYVSMRVYTFVCVYVCVYTHARSYLGIIHPSSISPFIHSLGSIFNADLRDHVTFRFMIDLTEEFLQ